MPGANGHSVTVIRKACKLAVRESVETVESSTGFGGCKAGVVVDFPFSWQCWCYSQAWLGNAEFYIVLPR